MHQHYYCFPQRLLRLSYLQFLSLILNITYFHLFFKTWYLKVGLFIDVSAVSVNRPAMSSILWVEGLSRFNCLTHQLQTYFYYSTNLNLAFILAPSPGLCIHSYIHCRHRSQTRCLPVTNVSGKTVYWERTCKPQSKPLNGLSPIDHLVHSLLSL